MVPRSMVRNPECDPELQMEQFRVWEHVSIAFWLTVKTISKDEVGGTALKLCSVWSISRQALKQLHEVVRAKHSSMKRLGKAPGRASQVSDAEYWYGSV